MAELVDALVSGTSVRKDVQVRVLFWVQKVKGCELKLFFVLTLSFNIAQVVKLVDTPAWGAGAGFGVQVRVLSWAQT